MSFLFNKKSSKAEVLVPKILEKVFPLLSAGISGSENG